MEEQNILDPLPGLAGIIQHLVNDALTEDLAMGDVTTESLIAPEWAGTGLFVAKSEGVIAGLPVAALVFEQIAPSIRFIQLVHDGVHVSSGDVIARVAGPLRGILMGERTALNFLQRMSGIATETARYVAEVQGTKALIIDTRKTAPGLRILDKYAVQKGGGSNHRHNLGDGVLIKDNHLEAMAMSERGITDTIRLARQMVPHTLKIEVEVESIDQAVEAASAGADIILLDNMSPEDMGRAVSAIDGRSMTEASGGITLANVRAVAEVGVDLISIGALTHSVKALDISLDIEPTTMSFNPINES
ncbi:MAG: carboxylating nicotinate-nucleotide diphosphorylase [Dehalococcoidia bacterium]|nr:carboxylating nicotinate-nucleotide diphosphorylase [Dehalococcoidia bacterium]